MPGDESFRIPLLIIFGTSLPIAAYHRLRANASGEPISHRAEGRLMFVSLRLSGLIMMLSVMAFLINPAWMNWSSFPLSPAGRWFGFTIGMAAAPLVAWTLNALGTNLTDTVVTRINHTLVTTGPYRFIRHPYYVFTFLMMLGSTLLTANWLVGLSGLSVISLLAIRSVNEEQMLIERFGEDYRHYIQRTGRFFPRLF